MPGVTNKYQIAKPEKHPEFKYLSFIRRGSNTTKSTLYYIKMKKSPVTAKQVSAMFPKFYRKPSDAANVCSTLERHGLLVKVYDNCWQITPLGVHSCYVLGKRDALTLVQMN